LVSLIESVLQEVLLRYGDRAYYVLKAAWEVSEEYAEDGRKYPGDFDFGGVVRKLRSWGIRYNPNQLLRIMEREYGVIETTYKSAAQHWYSFADPQAVARVLRDYGGLPEEDEGIADPEEYVLEIQIEAIGIDDVLRRIKAIHRKHTLSIADREFIRKFVIDELPMIAKVLKEALKFEDRFSDFIRKASLTLRLTKEVIAHKLRQGGVRATHLSGEPNVSIDVRNERSRLRRT